MDNTDKKRIPTTKTRTKKTKKNPTSPKNHLTKTHQPKTCQTQRNVQKMENKHIQRKYA